MIRPLRLTGTYFPGTDRAIRGPHAGAHFALFGVRDLATYDMSWAWTAGELISTPSDGGVMGQITVSLHSPDARRQLSLATNLSHYNLGITPELHPVDAAWLDAVVAGLCPDAAAQRAAAGTTTRLPLPGAIAIPADAS